MADDFNPFSGLGSAARRFWGPSEDERLLERRIGVAKEASAAEQARLKELGELWEQILSDAGGEDLDFAHKQFIKHPKFFALGGSTAQEMLKTYKEVTAPPKPVVVGEGGMLTTPEGEVLRKNPKTFEPEKPRVLNEGDAILDPGQNEPRFKNPRTFGPNVVGEGAALVDPGQNQPRYKNEKPRGELTEENKIDLKEQAKHGATIMQKVYEDASAARLDKPRFAQLREIVDKHPGGVMTWLKGFLADKGIPVAGKSDLDLWSAMLAQAAPRTREPGSGPFTDKDYEGAIKGLPNMLKSKDANLKIADMMLDMVEYRINRGGPAGGYLAGSMSRQQAFTAINGMGMKSRGPTKGRRRYNPDTGEFE